MKKNNRSEGAFDSLFRETATENIICIFVFVLVILEIVSGLTSSPMLTFGIFLLAIACLLIVPRLAQRFHRLPMRILYLIYVLPLLALLYPIAQEISRSLNDQCFDTTLILIDRFMFGGIDPTRWFFAHLHLSSLIVELLEYCYFTHYIAPFILGAELYRRRKFGNLIDYRFALIYGAILSFIVNMIIPAIGPRFTLHEFADLSKELPGVWIIDSLRAQLNSGEGITALMNSHEAGRLVLRNAFPSGHTMLTVLTIIFAFRYRATVRWVLLIVGTGLIISTIFLRYHYVIDVIAGIVFAIFTIKTAPTMQRILAKWKWNIARKSL